MLTRLALATLTAALAALSLPATTLARWHPPQHLTWYMQFTGRIDYTQPVAAYDLDGFDTSAAEVRALHAAGKRVICYIDAGTWENWRPDARDFPKSVLGRGDGWPGERWLDIRKLAVLAPIMTRRFEMCKRKGFDAVDPDNINGFRNPTGFPLTAHEQLRYDEWVARKIHALGMAVFEKNDLSQAHQLEPYFDGVIDEQCNQYQECGLLRPYLKAGKPVLNIEYHLPTSRFCAADNAAGMMGARLNVALNGARFEPCWSTPAPAMASRVATTTRLR
ncbi:MAG: endo alpha-1,4 polygalactosaminidase [Solirubrobacteraceae bacterium]